MFKNLVEQLNKNSKYLDIYSSLERGEKLSVFSGSLSEKILLLSDVNTPFCMVVENTKTLNKIKEHFEVINKKVSTVSYKLSGYIYHTAEQSEMVEEYYQTLYALVNKEVDVLLITPEVLMQKLPQRQLFKKHFFTLNSGVTYELERVTQELIKMGYKRRNMVENKGDFSLRGDILDVFPTHSPLPYRVQFFDDEVENIKTFNTLTYTTISDVKEVKISPSTLIFIEEEETKQIEAALRKALNNSGLEPNYQVRLNNIVEHILLSLNVNNKDASLSWVFPFLKGYNASILDYLEENSPVIFDGTKVITTELNTLFQEFSHSIKNLKQAGEVVKEHEHYYFIKKEIVTHYLKKPNLAFHSITNQNALFVPQKVVTTATIPATNYAKNYKLLASNLKNYLKQKNVVLLFGENSSSSVHLERYLKDQGISTSIITSLSQLKKQEVNIITASLKEGLILPEEKLVIIGSEQLFEKTKQLNIKRKNKKSVFTLPKVGDYVVHEVHGIGLCKSIERLKLAGYEKDYILIEYANKDTLYLPTEQVEFISSYVGGEEAPKLNKIGGAEFSKQKAKVKESVKKMAVNLVNLYASRQKRQGFSFVKDDETQQEFERAFPYTETEDQMIAINEVKQDMQSAKIMDRLICGDVGYGKTEVALRGAFKAVLSGKQVAFLAPTTILSEQHYNTCVARMEHFGVACDVLNRFKSNKEIKNSLENLENGTTNVICGTHRLLSKDVKFKDLGLLILDEEQRFGVADKEKIKDLKKHIDVITMSATPIPRTLHMSMIGVRDISLIETPPKDRLPVQTFVTEYSNALIVDAINREILRKGQVLVVYNRVESIYTVFEKLKALFPKVEMQVAHGQMPKHELETVIKNLYDGKIQLLLATTLIENGIDLPNANTLIVLNSDKLGLSQLYQLKGRVGRSSRLGYAYFTYEPQKVLTESAYKRLMAINEFTELGSGFKIALRDLEIRGAGNILGREQHGHMGKVGYDMYCKILEEAVKELKGEQLKPEKEVKMDVELNAFIPAEYIVEDENRFRIYSRLSTVETQEQLEETLKEIEDIYGKIPQTVINLALVAFMKNLGAKLDVKRISITSHKCQIEFYEKESALNENVNKTLAKFKEIAILTFHKGAIIEFNLQGYSINKKQETILNFLKGSL